MPTVKEDAHDPLGLTFPHFSSRTSIASLDETDPDEHTAKTFPAILLDRRHKLAAFWRSSVRKWLPLLFVTLYGCKADVHQLNHEMMSLNDLNVLDSFFIPVCYVGQGLAQSLKQRFHHWIQTREDHDQHRMPKTSAYSFTRYKISQLIHLMFEQEFDLSSGSLSLESLTVFFQWSIMESPAIYEVLELSQHGMCIASELLNNQILSGMVTPNGTFIFSVIIDQSSCFISKKGTSNCNSTLFYQTEKSFSS